MYSVVTSANTTCSVTENKSWYNPDFLYFCLCSFLSLLKSTLARQLHSIVFCPRGIAYVSICQHTVQLVGSVSVKWCSNPIRWERAIKEWKRKLLADKGDCSFFLKTGNKRKDKSTDHRPWFQYRIQHSSSSLSPSPRLSSKHTSHTKIMSGTHSRLRDGTVSSTVQVLHPCFQLHVGRKIWRSTNYNSQIFLRMSGGCEPREIKLSSWASVHS